MKPWVVLGNASIPGGGELRLSRRGDEFSILVAGREGELMNSRLHASEDALAELACARLAAQPKPRVLIGGLGMGFTLAAALRCLPFGAEVTVAELVPGVVAWNEGDLGACAGHPLRDGRSAFDAVLLDVDNGPEGLTHEHNHWLYSRAGLRAAAGALTPGGVLAVWSAAPSEAFTARLRAAGFQVEVHTVRARPGKGARHTIWLATPDRPA